MRKALFSISTSTKKGEIATGFDATRQITPKEEKIIAQAMSRLPRLLLALSRHAAEKAENKRELKKVKQRIGGDWI